MVISRIRPRGLLKQTLLANYDDPYDGPLMRCVILTDWVVTRRIVQPISMPSCPSCVTTNVLQASIMIATSLLKGVHAGAFTEACYISDLLEIVGT